MKIAFVTDGGLNMGMGHVYRSTTLAEELQDKGKIYFLTKSGQIVTKQIEDSGFNAIKLKNNNEIIRHLEKTKPNIIIIDKREVEENFAKEIKDKLNTNLIIFGNLSNANKYADVVINVIGSNFENKKFLDKNTGTLYFYGPRYIILRKEFYEFKRKGKKPSNGVRKILLLFGGSDPLNLTSKVLDKLLSESVELKIDVALGSGFVYFNELNKILAKYQNKINNIKLHRNAKNVAQLMYEADLAITSPGLSMFEALCVGTPVIAISQTRFHKEVFDKFFPTLHENDVGRLGDIIFSGDFIKPDTEYIRNLYIGEGKMELIEAIKEGN